MKARICSRTRQKSKPMKNNQNDRRTRMRIKKKNQAIILQNYAVDWFREAGKQEKSDNENENKIRKKNENGNENYYENEIENENENEMN